MIVLDALECLAIWILRRDQLERRIKNAKTTLVATALVVMLSGCISTAPKLGGGTNNLIFIKNEIFLNLSPFIMV